MGAVCVEDRMISSGGLVPLEDTILFVRVSKINCSYFFHFIIKNNNSIYYR
jgi:hypothetical protein